MPTYEYQCLDCGYKVEYFQSIKELPRTVCPRFQGRLTRLVTSGAGLIFKGSGFYETDYKKTHSSAGESSSGNGKSGEKIPAEKTTASEKTESAHPKES